MDVKEPRAPTLLRMSREWTLNTYPDCDFPPTLEDGSTFVEVLGDEVTLDFETDCCNGGTHSEHRRIPLAEVIALLEANGYEVQKPAPDPHQEPP